MTEKAEVAYCMSTITFTEDDMMLGEKEHNRPLMVTGYINDRQIKRIMTDNGSAMNLIPLSVLSKLGYKR